MRGKTLFFQPVQWYFHYACTSYPILCSPTSNTSAWPYTTSKPPPRSTPRCSARPLIKGARGQRSRRYGFFQVGGSKIELLAGTSPDSAITKFLAKKPEGIHHVAFEVDDIRAEMARLKGEGFVLLNEEPKRGADNKLVCFVHPKSAAGVLVELCQTIRLDSQL